MKLSLKCLKFPEEGSGLPIFDIKNVMDKTSEQAAIEKLLDWIKIAVTYPLCLVSEIEA